MLRRLGRARWAKKTEAAGARRARSKEAEPQLDQQTIDDVVLRIENSKTEKKKKNKENKIVTTCSL